MWRGGAAGSCLAGTLRPFDVRSSISNASRITLPRYLAAAGALINIVLASGDARNDLSGTARH